MKKPKKTIITKKYYNFSSIVEYIEEKYNIDLRDYKNKGCHFENYLKKYNLPKYDYPRHIDIRDGKITQKYYDDQYKLIHEQYKIYDEWIQKPGNEEPPYLNFWHWLVDIYEIDSDSYVIFNWKYHYEDDNTPDWIKEIIKIILDEFQEDEMECYIE